MLNEVLKEIEDLKELNEIETVKVKYVLAKTLSYLHYAKIHLATKNLDKVNELIDKSI